MIELFMGAFEDMPDRDKYVKSDRATLDTFPAVRAQFSKSKKLSIAIEEFKSKLLRNHYQGAYYFSLSEDSKKIYLRGYPVKKK